METQATPDMRVLVRHYPVGAEMTVTGKRKWKYNERKATDRATQSAESIRAACSRAETTVRRKCLAIGADRLLTLTMPGDGEYEGQDVDDAWAMFTAWLRRMTGLGQTFQYVAVAELQGRRAWHFHVGVNRYLEKSVVQTAWNAVGGGFVDLRRLAPDNRSADESVALYLTKYISKDFQIVAFGRRRFRCSKGIKIDVERVDLARTFVSSNQRIRDTFLSVTGKEAGEVAQYNYVSVAKSWGSGSLDYRYTDYVTG